MDSCGKMINKYVYRRLAYYDKVRATHTHCMSRRISLGEAETSLSKHTAHALIIKKRKKHTKLSQYRNHNWKSNCGIILQTHGTASLLYLRHFAQLKTHNTSGMEWQGGERERGRSDHRGEKWKSTTCGVMHAAVMAFIKSLSVF